MRVRVVSIAVVGIVWLAAGCERDGESLRAQLSAHQASWERQLSTIKPQHAALKQRFERKTAAPGGPEGMSPAARRLRAVLDGNAQSLVDVEIQIRQVGPRLEEALRRGGDEAQKVLEGDSGRMNEYLQALVADIGVLGRGLDDFGNAQHGNNGQTSEERE
jgi:hypothetical protein